MLALVLVAACAPRGATAPGQAVTPAGQPRLPLGTAYVGGEALQVELATTPEQRAAGLRGRAVPPGTGMAFGYPEPAEVRFTMAGVDRPLVAVFVRGGRALTVELLSPCAATVEQCPTYGPAEPVDLVVEAAPGTLVRAQPGDPVVLR